MDISNTIIENVIIETPIVLGATEEQIALKTPEEIEKDHHKDGEMTEEGWIDADGTLTPRHKKEPRMGMTQIDEYEIERWVKQMRRDFPEVDPALCDLVASHCYLHPETAEQFVKDKLENPTKKNHKEYFESLGLERAN